MEKRFIRVCSVKDLIISILFVVVGILLTYVPEIVAVNMGGYVLIVTGFAFLLLLKSEYKDLESGERYVRKIFAFPGNMRAAILSAVETAPRAIDLSQEGKGEHLRLEFYYGKKTGKAYLQLFEYVSYQYEVCSKVYEHKIEDVEKLIK